MFAYFWGTHRLVEMVSHRVGQRSYGVIKNEQVLVLILPKSKNQRVQDEAQVRDQLCACLLLQSGKCTFEKMTQVSTVEYLVGGGKVREHRGYEDKVKAK